MEETLINLYLSGYSHPSNKETSPNLNNDIQSDVQLEGLTEEEEKWRAQYGGVGEVESSEKHQYFQTIDLWDWRTEVSETQKVVVRLIGRRRSSDLRMALPFSPRPLKTAPVCQAHLDLVRVTTGKVYRLRRPSSKYIASSPFYDSSNPTRCWGFPEISEDGKGSTATTATTTTVSSAKKVASHEKLTYRDRAAERRTLHGGFGVGMGEKKTDRSGFDDPDVVVDTWSATFGTGSRPRKILESMGWKEGEALGCGRGGLVEPLQAVGNVGNAGLGWPLSR